MRRLFWTIFLQMFLRFEWCLYLKLERNYVQRRGGIVVTVIAKEVINVVVNEEIHFKNSHAAAILVRDQVLLFESMVQRFKTQSELDKKVRKTLGLDIGELQKKIEKELKKVVKLIGEDWSACSTKNYALTKQNFEFLSAHIAAILSGWQRLNVKNEHCEADILSTKVGMKGLISKLDYEEVLTKYLRVRERQKCGNVYIRRHVPEIEAAFKKKVKGWDLRIRELGDINSEWDNYSGENLRGKLPPFEISLMLTKAGKLLYEGRILYLSGRDRFFGAIHWTEMSLDSGFTPDDRFESDDLNTLLGKMTATLDIHRRDWEASIARSQKLAIEISKKRAA